MPYAPVLGRAETRPQPSAGAGPLPSRSQLIDAVAACQHQLADLLGRLDAGTSGSPASPDVAPEVAPVRQAVEATLQRLDEAAAREHGPAQLTEFEERVWRRLVEAMRADTRRLEADVRAALATLGAEVEHLDTEHTRAEATVTGRLANQLVDLEERVSQELLDIVRVDLRRVEAAVGGQVAALRSELGDVRREQTEREADLRGTLEHRDAVHASELSGLGDTIHRVDAVVADTETRLVARVDTRLAEFEARVLTGAGDSARGDARRVEAGLRAELAALRSNVDDLRRRQAESDVELRGAIEQQVAARAAELAGLGGAIARLDTELARSMAAIDARIVHHVRRARIAVDEEMSTLRRWVETTVSRSTGSVWALVARTIRDPLGAVTAVVNLLLEG